jgi:hypothetical protein
MTATATFSAFSTIDQCDLDGVLGGWSWGDFARNVGKGAAVGGVTGGVAGIWTGPGVAASAGIGAVAGAAGGAVEYAGGKDGLGIW